MTSTCSKLSHKEFGSAEVNIKKILNNESGGDIFYFIIN